MATNEERHTKQLQKYAKLFEEQSVKLDSVVYLLDALTR